MSGVNDTQRFFDIPELQAIYEQRVKSKQTEFKMAYPNEYKDEFHLDMIKQLVRSEMLCERFESMIHNNRDNQQTAWQLSQERVHLRQLYDMLMVSIKTLKEQNTKQKSPDILIVVNERRKRIQELRVKATEVQTKQLGEPDA